MILFENLIEKQISLTEEEYDLIFFDLIMLNSICKWLFDKALKLAID